MTAANDHPRMTAAGDLVLQEVWRAKDSLSAACGYDLDKLLAATRQREQQSGHPLVSRPHRQKVAHRRKAMAKDEPAAPEKST